GANPDLSPAHSDVLQSFGTSECHFIYGTDRVRLLDRYFYNRELYNHFDSDVGHFVGDTPYGEKVATYLNSDPDLLENIRSRVDTFCRHNYDIITPFSVNRRVPPSPPQFKSIP
ncbi:2B1E protein, partial [Campylorhamphus procurvoides]|nr:2B1E protein [Campylorhamphus procurvoides]NXC31190.1 2B1E protein [Campylorhamphus procurvoides]